MNLIRVVEPAVEPVPLSDIKAHLRLTPSDFDSQLNGLIAAARDYTEAVLCRRALITQTLEVRVDAFWGHALLLPRPPAQSIVSVKYLDSGDGSLVTLDPSQYVLDQHSDPARLLCSYGNTFPVARRDPSAVTVRYVAGYGAAASDIPPSLQLLIRLRVATWYQQPEAVGRRLVELPFAVSALARSMRAYT